jgi:isopenicillin-N epimerase
MPHPLREAFLLEPGLVFLNHGSFGACPRPVFDAWQGWQREMERNPVAFFARRSGALLGQARAALAGFVGAQPADLAFVPNATQGVNAVARSLLLAGRLQPGDEVLGTDLEYGACEATWRVACAAQGAVYRRVTIALPYDPAAFVPQMLQALTPRTRLVMLSGIGSTTALRLPSAPLCAALRARGVLSLVDGAHEPGQVDLALDTLGADYYTGNAHKWLCAPKGAAFLWARPEHHAQLHGPVTSWGDVDELAALPAMQALTGTQPLERRLQWQGTRDLSAALAVPAALDFRDANDWPAQQRRCQALLDDTARRIAARNGLAPISEAADAAPQMRAVPIRLPAAGPGASAADAAAATEGLRRWLLERHRIEVPITRHAGQAFVRISVQAYNDEADLAALERALAEAGV